MTIISSGAGSLFELSRQNERLSHVVDL